MVTIAGKAEHGGPERESTREIMMKRTTGVNYGREQSHVKVFCLNKQFHNHHLKCGFTDKE